MNRASRRSHPQRPAPDLVERSSQIIELCERCRAEGRFAFDTEFVMEDRFEADVCLIQVATRDGALIIDPMLDVDLEPVWALVASPDVQTVVHAGQEDLALCVQHTDRLPRNVVDVQIAAGLTGPDFPLSLQRLVQSVLHVRLHKTKTLTDWRKRPLTAAQLQYAAEDVMYLLDVYDRLSQRLINLDRLPWLREECSKFEDMSLYRRAEEEKLWRIKGAGSLKGRQLAVLQRVLHWREELARRLNRPPRVLLKDYLVIEIARNEMSEAEEIRDLRGVSLNNRLLHQLQLAVMDARKTPPEGWPQPKPQVKEIPGEASLGELVSAVVRAYCDEHRLAYSLVASKKSIRAAIRAVQLTQESHAESTLFSGWRGQTVGKLISDLLSGKRTVRVDPSASAIHVRTEPSAPGG